MVQNLTVPSTTQLKIWLFLIWQIVSHDFHHVDHFISSQHGPLSSQFIDFNGNDRFYFSLLDVSGLIGCLPSTNNKMSAMPFSSTSGSLSQILQALMYHQLMLTHYSVMLKSQFPLFRLTVPVTSSIEKVINMDKFQCMGLSLNWNVEVQK